MTQWLFVGLGNPGEEYASTRHNLGKQVVKAWYEQARERALKTDHWKEEKAWPAEVATVVAAPDTVVTCFCALTYMNESGAALANYLKYHPLSLEERLVVIHDDLEIPLGVIRSQQGGSDHGHKGVRSAAAALNTTAFQRLRIGIGRPQETMPVDHYVLSPFTPHEEATLTAIFKEASAILNKVVLPLTPPASHA